MFQRSANTEESERLLAESEQIMAQAAEQLEQAEEAGQAAEETMEQLDQQIARLVSRNAAISKLNAQLSTPFGFAFTNPLVQAALYAIGANIIKWAYSQSIHEPIHKGAIMALAGGPIAGFAAGLAIQLFVPPLREATYGSSSYMIRSWPSMVNFLLNDAATLATIPLGTQLVPFKTQTPLSELIIAQLVGDATIVTAFLALHVLLTAIACCSANTEIRKAVRQALVDWLRFITAIDFTPIIMAEATLLETPIATVQNNDIEGAQAANPIPQARPVVGPNPPVTAAMRATAQAISVATVVPDSGSYRPPVLLLRTHDKRGT